MAELPWPAGWSKPLYGGRVKASFIALFGLVCVLVAALTLVAGGASPLGTATAAFGLACLASAPSFWPKRSARALGTPDGLLLPYSRLRWVALMSGALLLAVASAGVALQPDPSPRDVVMGVAGVVLFGIGGGWATLRLSGDRGVLLAPAGVTVGYGGRPQFVAWEHVALVEARELAARTPMISIAADDVAHVVVAEGRVARALRRLNAAQGTDVWIAVSRLAIDPVLAYATIRYYHGRPEARPELLDVRARDRVARRAVR